MKKRLFLGMALLAAISLASCQKDLVVNEVDNAIGFGTYLGRDAQTKASVTDLDAMKDANYTGFGVFAYYTGTTQWSNTQNPTPNFMNNQKVYHNTTWDYNPKRYWPGGNDKITFFAYAPYESLTSNPTENITSFSLKNSTSGVPTLTFIQATEIDNQIDLLYATPQTNLSSGNVAFTFNHALSRIGFKVNTASRDDYKINITSITISGEFNTSGTMDITTGDFSGAQAETLSYTLRYNSANNITYVAGGTAINADEGYMMIIPKEELELTVNVSYTYQYKIDGTNYATAVNVDNQQGTVTVDFEKGKAYTLVLSLDPLSPIVFAEPTVTRWYPENGTDTNV